MRRKESLPGAEELVRCWEAGGAAVESGPGWKKEERIPAEEKESSRLEPLVWLRKELLLRLLLGVAGGRRTAVGR